MENQSKAKLVVNRTSVELTEQELTFRVTGGRGTQDTQGGKKKNACFNRLLKATIIQLISKRKAD